MKVSLLSTIMIAALAGNVKLIQGAAIDVGVDIKIGDQKPPEISKCSLECVNQAASLAGCSSFTDIQCVCTNQEYQDTVQQCLRTYCTDKERKETLALQEQQCAPP
ncbi:hypothetical protein BDZ91DRAFT_711205 [Kalaharituber pfeilii]|nr:hypothetical protein BDZ91DRAFT_711205 [Kalaharituber pfeilii]